MLNGESYLNVLLCIQNGKEVQNPFCSMMDNYIERRQGKRRVEQNYQEAIYGMPMDPDEMDG